MSDIATTIPRAALQALLNYSWVDELRDYEHRHDIEAPDGDPDERERAVVEHARANQGSDHIFVKMVRISDWLAAARPKPVPTQPAA